MSYFHWGLKPGEQKTFYSLFGASFKLNLIKAFVASLNAQFIKDKEKENELLIEGIKDNAFCVSGWSNFNHYLGNTYLDNVLRGGYPYRFDGRKIYYVFSRKHGDLERDYNKFKLLPSYFSEGEANYRDINQNRRIDLFFNPFIEKSNIIYFLNLLKIDGYNPLVVKGKRLFLTKKEIEEISKEFALPEEPEFFELMHKGFYLGEFFKALKEKNIFIKGKEALAERIVEVAAQEPVASFGDGYWIDHWHYNLDLIENYLYFYPEGIKELFLSKDYYYWDDAHRVKERYRRYYLKGGRIYQWHALEEVEEKKKILSRRKRYKNFLRTKEAQVYRTNLCEKILSLILNKAASLDPEGIGIEMEADKPGWCDSLNGLPALFGSSLVETLELKRA